MELLAFGKTGWGDELFYATLMTIAVSVTAMLIGFVFALIFTPLKLSKYKLLNLIGLFKSKVLPTMPVSAKVLMEKYGFPEGKTLGNKLKMIEEEWVNNNLQLSEKQINEIMNS